MWAEAFGKNPPKPAKTASPADPIEAARGRWWTAIRAADRLFECGSEFKRRQQPAAEVACLVDRNQWPAGARSYLLRQPKLTP